MANFGYLRVSQQGTQQAEEFIPLELLREKMALGIAMTAGKIPDLVCIHTEGDAHQVGLQGIKGGGFSV
jgi:hypothetical protein